MHAKLTLFWAFIIVICSLLYSNSKSQDKSESFNYLIVFKWKFITNLANKKSPCCCMITNNSKCSSDSRQDQGQEGPRQEEGGGGGEPGGPDRLPAGQVHEGHPESGPGRQLRPGGDPGGAAQHHEGNQEELQENQGGDLRAGGDGDGACQDQQVFTEDDQDRSRGGGEREGVTANKKIKQKVRFIFLFIQAIRKMQIFGAFTIYIGS